MSRYSGIGRISPQAVDMEEAILGAILLDKDAVLEVSDFLKEQCFYKDNHQKIYRECLRLFGNGDPIDILTISASLQAAGDLEKIGGRFYIVDLTSRVASAANIQYHARIVYQKYLQRELIRIGTETITEAYDDTTDVLDLLEKNQLALIGLTDYKTSQQSERIDSLIDAAVKQIDTPAIGNLTGIGTGFICVDTFTAGWQKCELTILAARPAMGKTALMMQIARNAAVIYKVPTVVFSLEMSKHQITNRMISNETEIFLEKINKKTLTVWDRQDLEGKLYKLKNSPLHIDDTPALTTVAFRSKCIRMKRLYDIQFILVDYLQLMRGTSVGKGGTRDQEIGDITRTLKAVSKELHVPVIALSQFSRSTEKRPGQSNRPQLGDLRESGNIEQDADNVIALYRPEYYGIEVDADNRSTAQMAELIWLKHRNGACDTLYLKWRAAVMRFENWVNLGEVFTPDVVNNIKPNVDYDRVPDNESDEEPF